MVSKKKQKSKTKDNIETSKGSIIKKTKKLPEQQLEAGRWIALKTKEFGWLAGWIREVDDEKITVRVERRHVFGQIVNVKSLRKWDELNPPTTMTFFKLARNCPRIIVMPFKKDMRS